METEEEEEAQIKRKQTLAVFVAVLFAFTCLGTVFVLFPISNPLILVGGNFGAGIFYASLFALGMFLILLLFLSIRSTVKDIFLSVCDDLGIDGEEIIKEIKVLFVDEWMILRKQKKRKSDSHYDEEDE